jgi:predicted PurR-regulated permease PerM
MNMKLKQTQGSPILSFLLGAGGLVLLVLGMRTASGILNPIFLAFIFAFAFQPLLAWLQRKGLATWLAFLITILIVFVGVLAVFFFLIVSINQLIVTIPTYEQSAGDQQLNIQAWLADRGIDVGAILDSISFSSIFPIIENIAKAVVQTLGGTFMMLFILAFMLFETMALPNKMVEINVSSHPFVQRFANFGGNIRKYVTVLTGINFLVGVADAIFLMILGVDFPILWGLLAWFLGYIPSVGFWLALIPPFLLAFAEFGIGKALLVLLGYVLINGSIQNIVQPKLMGDEVDLSPLSITASLFIWTWIIGPMGALLAVPLTMAVQKLVLEPYPESRWLAELMSAGPQDIKEDGGVPPASDDQAT